MRIDDSGGTPDGNRIGTANVAIPMNTIAVNDDDGIALEGGTRTAMLRNAVFDNAGLGIDLDNDDVTLNDAGDGDAGANGLVNFPEITGATATAVDWQLVDSLPDTTFRLELYANGACDGLGHGEGQRFLGTIAARTNAGGMSPGARRSPPPPANL